MIINHLYINMHIYIYIHIYFAVAVLVSIQQPSPLTDAPGIKLDRAEEM